MVIHTHSACRSDHLVCRRVESFPSVVVCETFSYRTSYRMVNRHETNVWEKMHDVFVLL